MTTHTPTTDEVRGGYPRSYSKSMRDEYAEFDRWLAEVRAAAWDEGYRAGGLDGYFERREETNPYRHDGFDHCPSCQAAHQQKEAEK